MPIATMHDSYLNCIDSLILYNAEIGQGPVSGLNVYRPWMMYVDYWNGDPNDLLAMKQPFNRTAIAEQYAEVLNSSKGSAGDASALKHQSDLLSCHERAFRVRHLT